MDQDESCAKFTAWNFTSFTYLKASAVLSRATCAIRASVEAPSKAFFYTEYHFMSRSTYQQFFGIKINYQNNNIIIVLYSNLKFEQFTRHTLILKLLIEKIQWCVIFKSFWLQQEHME